VDTMVEIVALRLVLGSAAAKTRPTASRSSILASRLPPDAGGLTVRLIAPASVSNQK
jgi:hypothetical protein